MSNFTFLKTDWPDLYVTASEAEQNVNSAPRTSCFYARRSLERAVKWLYANDSYLKQPYAANLAALIHGLRLRSAPDCCPFPKSKSVPERSRRGLFPKILTIQKIGNQLHEAIWGLPLQSPALTRRRKDPVFCTT